MSVIEVQGTIVLVGAGRMGGAMLQSWLDQGLEPAWLTILDPRLPDENAATLGKRGVAVNPDPKTIKDVSALVLAVKPQIMAEALPAVSGLVGPGTLVLSIMAGKTLRDMARHLPLGAALVRAMPNTPAAIGRGVTVAVANETVTLPQRALGDALMRTTGLVEWVEDEQLIDAVTALSGSGPAYVFHLVEALAAAGVAAGLPDQLAMTLARATVAGSGELLFRSEEPAAALRQAVTSPGGTTAAALEVLMGPNGLTPLMTEALAAAKRRAQDLAG